MASKLGIAVAFSNTPQAKDDVFTFGETVGGAVTFLNVMANDSGGNAKSLYSVDDGVNSGGPTGDLLVKDQVGVIGASALGARIWITADGRIAYDASTLDLNSLAQGQVLTDTVTYAIQLGKGALSWATVTVTISGSNDTPIIQLADATGVVIEDGSTPTLSTTGAIGFDDADLTDTHSVTVVAAVANGLGGVLTASITDVATGSGAGSVTWSYSVANSATQYLAAGEIVTETYTVTVSDGQGGSFNQMVTITITGTNDAPVVTGAVAAGAVTEDGVTAATGTIAFSDVDLIDAHNVTVAAAADGYLGTFTASVSDASTGDGAGVVGWNFAADNAALQFLAAGETRTQTYTVTVSDGQGGSFNQMVTITITGTNDAPVVTGAVTGVATEDGAGVTLDALANASDVDAGAILSVVDVPGALPAGVTYNPATGSFTLDPANAAYQSLAAGATTSVSVSYGVSDGTVTTPASVSWTVTGTNDAPAIGGVSTGSVTEDTATSASGAVTISDADTGQSSFQPQSGLAGNYGSLNINTAGNWTYFLNNSLPAVQSLSAGQTLSDTVTVRAADGTNHVLNFTISGTNEPGVATTLFTSGADVGVTFYSNSNSSSIGNEPYTIGQGAVSFGYDVSYSNTTNNTAMAGFLADKEVLIFPELEGGSGTTIGAQVGAAVAAFVNGGGTLVVNSASGQQFLNAAFGFGLSGGSGGTSVLSSGAAGTLFANNASNLSDNSAVYGGSLISSLPAGARVIYADNAGTNANVFVLQQGQGQITFLAWDWFNASPVGTANGGWIEVLRDALSYGGNRSSTLNDPIAIDLDGDGVHFGGAVDFDLSADGIAETLVWTSPRDGLLVMDLDGSGAIENGREVLSEVFDGFGYGSSMEALRSLDTNIDGKVDAADERFAALRVWRDANSDGVSQAEELLSFDELGIESISVVETVQNSIVDGQQAYAAGTFTYLNGESGDYSAVYLSAPATEGMTADGTNASPMLISDDDIVPTYSAPLGYESALATEQEPGVVYEAELAFMMLGLDTTSPTDSTGFAPEETALADPLGLGQPPVYTPADDGAIL